MTSHIKNISTVLLVFFFALLASNCAKDSDLFYELSQYEEEQEIVYEEEATDEQSENEESSEEEVESNPAPEETSSDETEVEVPNPDFTYSSMQDAFNNASLWQDGAIVKIEGLQGGSFTYYANTSTSSDGGLILDVPNRSGKLARIWNKNGVVKAEWYGMIPNDVTFNNAPYFQKVVETAKGEMVTKILFSGIYNFDNYTNLNGVDNLTLEGENAVITGFYTDNLDRIIWTVESANNIHFKNLKFESRHTADLGQGNSSGLVLFANSTFNNHSYTNCEFTAPYATINGIKWYVSDPGTEIRNVKVNNCYFHDLGRMGLEAVSHYFADDVNRYFEIVVKNSVFENTGIFQYGMGLSFSGEGENIIIQNNKFIDNRTTAIELIGADNVTIDNNTAEGLGSFIHAVNGTTKTNENLTISNNSTIGIIQNGNMFMQVDGMISFNNKFESRNATFLQGSRNLSFNNDEFYSQNEQVFKIFRGNWLPVENVRFDNCKFSTDSNNEIFLAGGTNGQINNYEVYCSSFYKSGANDFAGIPAPHLENINVFNFGEFEQLSFKQNINNCKKLPE